MMKKYDIGIIGAGPAGSMLARLLEDKGYSVAIFDMRKLGEKYQGKGYIKPCGGMLSPDAQKFLKKQNITLPIDIFDEIQPKKVKTYDLVSKIIRYYKRNYINMNREKFDRFLLEGIKADKYFSYIVRDIKENQDGFVINNEFCTKILVGADGAKSKVRSLFFPNLKIRKYVCIQDVLPSMISDEYECFFDENMSDYYGWSLPKDGKTLVGFAIDENENVLEKFENFKINQSFEGSIERQGALILRPNFLHKVCARKNLFLIGEAGGYISPSSAEGISYAFKTAKILVDSNFEMANFKRKMRTISLNLFYKNVKSLIMYVPFIRKIVMRLSFGK